VTDVCADLKQSFDKWYNVLFELNEFNFKTALARIASEINEIANSSPPE
jgi:hypothetical protein